MRHSVFIVTFVVCATSPGSSQTELRESTAIPDDSWISELRWRSIGPGSMGGRIVDLAVVESDPGTYYVGTASGGVFKTENRGVTFDPVFDKAGSLSIGDISLAPSDPRIVWAGTGEHNARNSVSWGDGVYKSTDAGKTWRRMGLERSFQIGRIAVHPENPDVVFVGALGRLWGPNEERGLFQTTDGGETWRKALYVDESTGCVDVAFCPADSQVLLAAMYERQRDAFDGGNPAKRWGLGSGLYRSADGGQTWKRLTAGLPTVQMGRIGIQWSRANPATAYAIIETEKIGTAPGEPDTTRVPAYMGITGVDAEGAARLRQVIRGGPADRAGVREDDLVLAVDGKPVTSYEDLVARIREHAAGETVRVTIRRGEEKLLVELTFGRRSARGGGRGGPFGALQSGQQANVQKRQGELGFETGGVFKSTDGGNSWSRVNSLNPRPFYYSQIHIDPKDDRIVYVLGIALHMSRDGGKTFETTARGVHPDHHAMWIDPDDGRHVLQGCDGGLYVTHDRTRHWEFVNNLPIGQFYHVTVDTRRPYRIYGGLQDNGSWGGPSATRSSRGVTAEDWFSIGYGDGFVCQADPEDPDLVYWEMQYGRVTRLDLRTGQRSRIQPPRKEDIRYRFNWKTPFLLSSHNPRIFYLAGNYVFRSLDRGEGLRIVSPEITRTDRGSATALAESPVNPDVLYVGTDDGALWVTRDGRGGWKQVTESLTGVSGLRRVSSIEASKFAEGRVYVTLDGHYYDDGAPYALVSEDFGGTWKSLRANLPETSTRTLREDLENPDVLYLGTEFGTWVSLDRGGRWMSLTNNMPAVAIHEFAQHRAAGELVAGTHGRGIWILDITPLRQSTSEVRRADSHLFRPRPAVLWSGSTGRWLFGHKRFLGENPPRGAVLYYRLAKKADSVNMKVLDASGKEIRQLQAKGDRGLHRVVWDLRRGRQNRRARFGSGVEPGKYRVVLTVDDTEHTADLLVERDPSYPRAPTFLEVEEEEYELRMGKLKGSEFTD